MEFLSCCSNKPVIIFKVFRCKFIVLFCSLRYYLLMDSRSFQILLGLMYVTSARSQFDHPTRSHKFFQRRSKHTLDCLQLFV